MKSKKGIELIIVALFMTVATQAQTLSTATRDSLLQKQKALNAEISTLQASLTKSQADLASINAKLAPQWTHKGLAGISATQATFANWSAGGQNSLATSAYLNAELNYASKNWMWNTALNTIYGRMHTAGYGWYKAADNLNLTTKGGRALDKKKLLYLTMLANLQTQYAKGKTLPTDPGYISNWMAPGYINFAIGFDYNPWKWFSLFFSPVNDRMTFVNDAFLAHQNLFGIGVDKKFQNNVGIVVNNGISITLFKNLSLISKLDLFTPYNNQFGNIVVNWNVMAALKLTKYITATANLGLKYDNNIKTANANGVPIGGPKVQFNEILGLGISYNF